MNNNRTANIIDELDSMIIQILQVDGRSSNAQIAREVAVSEGTVRRRLRKLMDDDVLKVIAIPNLEKMGYTTAALIGLQTEPGQIDEVADAVSALDEVHYVAVTTGAYDIFAWVGVSSSEDLGSLLRGKIGSIQGVRRTETFVNLAIKKRGYGLVL